MLRGVLFGIMYGVLQYVQVVYLATKEEPEDEEDGAVTVRSETGTGKGVEVGLEVSREGVGGEAAM